MAVWVGKTDSKLIYQGASKEQTIKKEEKKKEKKERKKDQRKKE